MWLFQGFSSLSTKKFGTGPGPTLYANLKYYVGVDAVVAVAL